MSKSIGNVIDPIEVIEKYGVDAVRYYFLRHQHPYEDGDFTLERFHEVYTANLVNGLGNLVSRVMKMAETNLNEPVPIPELSLRDDKGVGLAHLGDSFDFQKTLDSIWSGLDQTSWLTEYMDKRISIKEADELIQIKEPFKKIKSNSPEEVNDAKKIITVLVIQLWYIALQIEPFMPNTAKIIKEAVLANKKPETMFPRIEV